MIDVNLRGVRHFLNQGEEFIANSSRIHREFIGLFENGSCALRGGFAFLAPFSQRTSVEESAEGGCETLEQAEHR